MLDSSELGLRKRYWLHVRACLVQFHKLSLKNANQIVDKYQERFPVTSEDSAVEVIYHFEPFRLACKITGKRLSVKDFADRYRNILDSSKVTYRETAKGNLVRFGTIGSGSTVKETKVTTGRGRKVSDGRPAVARSGTKPAAASEKKAAAGKRTAARKVAGATTAGTKKTSVRKGAASKAVASRSRAKKTTDRAVVGTKRAGTKKAR